MGAEKYPVVGGIDAGYKFEFKPDGIYLTIYPSDTDNLLFELSDMRQILRDCGIMDYDIALLSRTMREASGVPCKIANPVELSEEDLQRILEDTDVGSDENYAELKVDISRDKMKATIKYITKNGSRLPTFQMVMDALAENNVTYGIDEDAIHEGIQSLMPFVAAQGDPPIAGENAYIDRKFDLGVKGRPVIDEYDRVDYKDLNLFVLVKKNDTLAIRIPQTQGKPGTNIFGDKVPAQNGRPIPMPEGKNTQVVGENQLIATINGQIVDSGNKISVDPRFIVKGSVGVATGDIDFDGSVEIAGDVKQGFNVKATGDIEIKGNVNGAEVSGRNVIIGGGITGVNRGKVYAKHDVRCAFTENAIVEAGRDIYVADVALHSTLRAGKKVMVEDKHGQITGGLTVAGEEVRAKIIGNQAYVITRISVGVDPNLQKEYNDVCKSYKEGKKRLMQITQTLNTLGKIDISTLPPERVAQINALTRSQFPLAGQIKRDEKKIIELEALLADMKNGKIKASDTIYPGSRLSINSVVKNIQEEYKYCTMTLQEGEVTVGPY
ncbi:MAG: DUF342 domain-containing protein [Selenomonadaceae bacterium]|nr:DUF342 domain-containing protein [Selenomonadaceae bacterium]